MLRASLLLLVVLSGTSWADPLPAKSPPVQSNHTLIGSHSQGKPTLVEQQRANLIAEAESKNYAIEYIGTVSQKKDICGLVQFNFNQWLNDKYYSEEATRIIKKTGVTITPSLVYDLTSEFLEKAVAKFEQFVAGIDEYTVGPFETVLTVEVTAQKRTYKTTGGLTSLLLSDLDTVTWIFRDTLRENLKTLPTYSKELYMELAERILGPRYTGSLVEDFGVNSAEHFANLTLKGKSGQSSVIAEVCMSAMSKKDAFDGFVIHSKGKLTDDSYEHLDMNQKYVQDPQKPGLDNLLEADFSLNNAGIYVASEFLAQKTSSFLSNHCALKTPGYCSSKSYSLLENNGTILINLMKDTLVITRMKALECTDKSGKKSLVWIESPIFVHTQTESCWNFSCL